MCHAGGTGHCRARCLGAGRPKGSGGHPGPVPPAAPAPGEAPSPAPGALGTLPSARGLSRLAELQQAHGPRTPDEEPGGMDRALRRQDAPDPDQPAYSKGSVAMSPRGPQQVCRTGPRTVECTKSMTLSTMGDCQSSFQWEPAARGRLGRPHCPSEWRPGHRSPCSRVRVLRGAAGQACPQSHPLPPGEVEHEASSEHGLQPSAPPEDHRRIQGAGRARPQWQCPHRHQPLQHHTGPDSWDVQSTRHQQPGCAASDKCYCSGGRGR